jgi:glycerol-3-phosphate acyltransferase PlsY
VLTLLCDSLKGWLPVWLYLRNHAVSNSFFDVDVNTAVVAFTSIIGHVFPIGSKFRGGKGVATLSGAYIAISPFVSLILLNAWFVVFFVWRTSSLAALVSICVTAPIIAIVAGVIGNGWNGLLFSLLCAALILFTHRKNISRLLNGQELKV